MNEITKTSGCPNNGSDRVGSSDVHCSSMSRGATRGASGICLKCLLYVSPGGVLLSESGNLSHLELLLGRGGVVRTTSTGQDNEDPIMWHSNSKMPVMHR